MALGNERDLIPVITRLSRESKSIDEAIRLFQAVLAGELGGATLLLERVEEVSSPRVAKATAAFMESRQFPFRGLYTAPLVVGNRKIGRLIACFGSFGVPGKSLSALTAHVAEQLSGILARSHRSHIPQTVIDPLPQLAIAQPATTHPTTHPEAA